METDDLATLWQSGNASLRDVPITFGALEARNRVRRTLFSMAVGRWFTLGLNAVTVLLIGSFTGDHLFERHVGLASLVLFLTALALLASSILQVVILARTDDLSASPLAVQRRVAMADRIRVATDTAIVCASPLLWMPLFIVGVKLILGFDAVVVFPMPWMLGNLGFGLAVLLLGAVFVGPLRRLMAGTTLTRVNARLADLARFARESPSAT